MKTLPSILRIVCATKLSSQLMIFGSVKGGGHGGAIRQSGGKIGERGAVLEEDYFHQKDKIQLEKLKEEMDKTKKSKIEEKQEKNDE